MAPISSILKLHFKNKNRVISRESSTLEFKESFIWGDREGYAKTMLAFANNRGGYICFGIKDFPQDLIGLKDDTFERFDVATIAQYLGSLFSSEIIFEKATTSLSGKKIGLLLVKEAIKKPVVVTKTIGGIRDGEVYFRYTGRTDRIKSPELLTLLSGEHMKQDDKWRTLLQKMGRVSDAGSAMVISKDEGSSVRITDDPSVPAVRVAEDPMLGGYSLRHRDIVLHMKQKGIVMNKKFNTILQQLAKNLRYCRVRYFYPNNPKSPKTKYFHPRILNELIRRCR